MGEARVNVLSLDGRWEFRRVGQAEWLPATVPGCNFTDLMAVGRLADPFAGDNERRVAWVHEAGWEYRRNFVVGAGLRACDSVVLECDGLDTLATVFVNGAKVGECKNQHCPHRYDVKDRLVEGENRFSVAIVQLLGEPLVRSVGQIALVHLVFAKDLHARIAKERGAALP